MRIFQPRDNKLLWTGGDGTGDMGRWRRTIRVLTVCVTLFAAGSGAARPVDLPGWGDTRWGMDETALGAALGDRLQRLPGPLDYGDAYADRAIEGVEVGGVPFRAIFQINRSDGRLKQVLLEHRGAAVEDARAVIAATEAAFGPPDRVCAAGDEEASGRLELRWRFPTTSVHIVRLDFTRAPLLLDDPNSDDGPLVLGRERRRIDPGDLPRRLLIRYFPTARSDLVGSCPGA